MSRVRGGGLAVGTSAEVAAEIRGLPPGESSVFSIQLAEEREPVEDN